MRVGQLGAVSRVLAAAGAAAIAGIPLAASPASPAPSADPIAEAKQRVDEAQDEANAAAARFTDAQSRYEVLGDEIAEIEGRIRTGEARAEHLREIVQRRAVVAYKTRGADLSVLFDADSPREGLRSSELLAAANSADNEAAVEYAALADDLAVQRERLASERNLQKEALDQMAEERKLLDAKLAVSQEALRNLQARQAAGLGIAPVIDGLVCPVPGAAFSNDFGQPRTGHTHQGNDMFAPIGSANLAVVSGSVTFGDGGAGGMGAYLDGDNGVTYIYYHLSEYVGGPREVAQGEIIGKVGQTGNAGAPHTHFEIRPGGRPAPAVNPYPTLTKIC